MPREIYFVTFAYSRQWLAFQAITWNVSLYPRVDIFMKFFMQSLKDYWNKPVVFVVLATESEGMKNLG